MDCLKSWRSSSFYLLQRLLSTTYKISSIILLSRLTQYAEEVFVDHQCGFLHKRSTTDHMWCLLDLAPLWQLKNKNHLDATYYSIVLLIGWTCFGHYCAHHQELATIMLLTTLVVSLCKDGEGRVNIKLWFLVLYVRCEVLCRLVVADNVFLLILTFRRLMSTIVEVPHR